MLMWLKLRNKMSQCADTCYNAYAHYFPIDAFR